MNQLQIQMSCRKHFNPIESQGLTLKPHEEHVINNALSVLDNSCMIKPIKLKKENKHGQITNPTVGKILENQPNIILEESQSELQTELIINTQNLIKQELQHYDLYLSKKYFFIWKEKTSKSQEKEDKCQINEEQINKFINTLKAKRSEKLKSENKKRSNQKYSDLSSLEQDKTTNSEIYANRYKAQRDIILMQKSKLLEQEKLIHELQFGKICEELKTSYDDSQAAIKQLLKKVSTKTKIKTGIPALEEPEEVQMKINKVPKVVRMMEERAKERELKRQIIQERKRLIDEEKQRLKAEQIENKRIQDEEEKKRALDAIKERRRKEVEEEKRKQAEKANYLRKCKVAGNFYIKSLKKRSILGFKKLMEQRENNEALSIAFYEAQLLRQHFYNWKLKVRKIKEDKEFMAGQYFECKLKAKCLNMMKINLIKSKQNMQVAMDYYDYQIQCKIFKQFYLIVNKIKIRRYHIMNIALKHYKSRLLVQTFYQWKGLPAVLQLERAKEEKKRKWREKVLEVLPDYKPPELL